MPLAFVVEGDTEARSTLTRLLSAAGFDVQGAPGAEQALSLLQSHERTPDVVVLDPALAGDGQDLVDAVRRLVPADTPVVLVSAINDLMMPVKFRLPVIYKPNFDGLVSTIRHYLRGEEPRSSFSPRPLPRRVPRPPRL